MDTVTIPPQNYYLKLDLRYYHLAHNTKAFFPSNITSYSHYGFKFSTLKIFSFLDMKAFHFHLKNLNINWWRFPRTCFKDGWYLYIKYLKLTFDRGNYDKLAFHIIKTFLMSLFLNILYLPNLKQSKLIQNFNNFDRFYTNIIKMLCEKRKKNWLWLYKLKINNLITTSLI